MPYGRASAVRAGAGHTRAHRSPAARPVRPAPRAEAAALRCAAAAAAATHRCALCAEPTAAAALTAGSSPPLMHILSSLPAALSAAPLLDGPSAALHAALAACVREATRATPGRPDAASATAAALAALLAHNDARWAAAERALTGGSAAQPGVRTGAPRARRRTDLAARAVRTRRAPPTSLHRRVCAWSLPRACCHRC